MSNYCIERRFEYKGYPCVVIFQLLGYRCGYVGLPKEHKYYGEDLSASEPITNICCNGGITYSADYLVGQKDKDTWWIGFDCGHYWDGLDLDTSLNYFTDQKHREYLLDLQKRDFGRNGFIPKDLKFVIDECKHIVDQID